jgi:uncharacterized protein (TIGR00297 family)
MVDSCGPSFFAAGFRARVALSVLLAAVLCLVLYPRYAAAAALAVLLGGSAAAYAICRGLNKPALPWNAQRSWPRLVIFAAGALPVSLVALRLFPCPLFLKSSGAPEWPFVWTLSVLAAASGAFMDSLKGPGPTALRVPLGSGAVIWLLAGFLSFGTRALPADTHVQPEVFLRALAVNGAFGAAVLLLRFADLPAAALGACVGTIVYFFAEWQGYLLLVLFVAAGSLLSKFGWQRKKELGVTEAREGRRGIANAAANLLVPAACCLAYPASGGDPAYLMAYAGALAAAFADTASAEVGVLSGRQPVLITSGKRMPHGANGAVSVLGFVGAFLACALMAALAWKDGFLALVLNGHYALSWRTMSLAAAAIGVGGIAGTIVDSILGATVEDRWAGVGKGFVNFVCTLTGALVAGGLTRILDFRFSIFD